MAEDSSSGNSSSNNSSISDEYVYHRRDSSAPVVPLGFEDPDVLLHLEKLKVQELETKLSNYIKYDEFFKNIKLLFGCDINELIPNHLDNKTKTRYKMLFYGFIRVNCNIKIIIIPDVIIGLISNFYFPTLI